MTSIEQNSLYITYNVGPFKKEEMDEIDEIIAKIVPVKRRFYSADSMEKLPAYMIFTLGYVFGGISRGFFESLGSDIYNNLKNKIKNILSIKERRGIIFEMNSNSTKIYLMSTNPNEDEIEKIFDTIDKAKNLAIDVLKEEDTPELTELRIFFDEDWDIREGWYISPEKMLFYDYENKKWKIKSS